MFTDTLAAFLRPAPHAAMLPKEQVAGAYLKHRILNFIGIFTGYLSYYLLRNNFSLAMPYLKELGFSKSQLGWVLTALPAAYGLSKFLMGNLSDHSNPRYFLTLGLLISSVAVFMIGVVPGWVTCIPALGVLLFLNGCVQGMGAPPCYRTIAHWFSVSRRGRVVSVWSTSHNVGAALLGVFVATCAGSASKFHLFSWEAIFWFPAAVVFVMALIIMAIMVDTPQSVGLPPVEKYDAEYEAAGAKNKTVQTGTKSEHDEEREMSGKEIMFKYVLVNRTVWLLAFAEIFVYVVRYGVSNWTPLYVSEGLHLGEAFGGTCITIFEISGIIGMLLCGYLSDRYFKENRALLSLLCFVLVGIGLVCYRNCSTEVLASCALALIGAFIYGPILLVGVQAMDVVPKKAVGTAIGLLGLFGYWGGNISAAALLGYVVEHYSWNGAFNMFYGACILGMAIFMTIMLLKPKAAEK